MSVLRIVSGGQTGVDRGALDAALEAGVDCGGWCPDGRRAEDGPIPARYPLHELPGAGYRERTRRNAQDSDATLLITFGTPAGGTAATLDDCRRLARPVLVIDATVTRMDEAVRRLEAFVIRHGVGVLNVAGPRASDSPEAYARARAILAGFLAERRD